jgi:hypothetical protein
MTQSNFGRVERCLPVLRHGIDRSEDLLTRAQHTRGNRMTDGPCLHVRIHLVEPFFELAEFRLYLGILGEILIRSTTSGKWPANVGTVYCLAASTSAGVICFEETTRLFLNRKPV